MSNEGFRQSKYGIPDVLPRSRRLKECQSVRVLRKFGGPRRLAAIFKAIGVYRNPATIYKWTYPRSRGGTGGLIPSSVWADIILAARVEGVLLTPQDMDVRDM